MTVLRPKTEADPALRVFGHHQAARAPGAKPGLGPIRPQLFKPRPPGGEAAASP